MPYAHDVRLAAETHGVTVPVMRITSIEAYTYELGYRYGTYVMSGGRVVKTLTSTVVRVVTDDGIDGWAETCPLGSTYLPAHARGAGAGAARVGTRADRRRPDQPRPTSTGGCAKP